jgi:hypothetical protein
MRLAAALTALCLLPGIAAAQTPDCRTIRKSADRLACYDKAALPAAQEARPAAGAARLAPKQVTSDQQRPLADMLEVENSRLEAKIKTICRGC